MFLAYLRSFTLNIDVLCLQEVSSFYTQDHLTEEQSHYFNTFLFPNRSTVFSKHCAIICLNPSLSLDQMTISLDERIVSALICDEAGDSLFPIINVNGPAQSSERMSFLGHFMSLSFLPSITGDCPGFLLGDFNLNISHLILSCQDQRFREWYEWLTSHFNNCFSNGKPTFQRGSSRTVIDYIYCHSNIASLVSNCQQHYLPSSWTDHQLLCVDVRSPREDIGPGSWRFNITFLNNNSFLALLDDLVNTFLERIDTLQAQKSPQQIWESFKVAIKDTAEIYSRSFKKHHHSQVHKLQTAYQTALSRVGPNISDAETNDIARQLEDLLDASIVQESEQLYLRSATRWHEKGERNNKYFFQVIKTRQKQQTIQAVRSNNTGELLTSTEQILAEARNFYNNLYTPDDVDSAATDLLLQNIPDEAKLNSMQRQSMVTPPTMIELLGIIDHTPAGKSPGLDGLPFEVYRYVFSKFLGIRSLFLKVLQEAFLGNIPFSWKQTRMVLLFKKGDPTQLSNWRPLSLINSDAKLFTKLLANRFNKVLPGLINPYQTGFMPHRLISDNGFVNLSLMSNFRNSTSAETSSAVAILLDQEKAYDRVHPNYLERVLLHFGFPNSLVSALRTLFFGTSINISINGFLSAPLKQGRGLRQGDPLSPLLFNLAFEPLLRTILVCPSLSGVQLQPVSVPVSKRASPIIFPLNGNGSSLDSSDNADTPTFKLLSYADDLEVFLSSSSEWYILQDILQVYGKASNARVNIHKTEIVSLSGRASTSWTDIANQLNILYHTDQSSTAVRYLGYPLFSTTSQLLSFLGPVKEKIQRHCTILSSRGLSVRGLSILTNSVVLSTLWHLLRVVPVPEKWLNEIRTVVRKFTLPFWPAPSWDRICAPKSQGGLSIVDIHSQQYALKMVFLQRILQPKSRTDFVSPLIAHSISLYTGHRSLLPWCQFPKMFLNLLKTIPTVYAITYMISKLPKLVFHPEWSGRWMADTPLRCALISTDTSSTGRHPLNITSIPLRHLVSDVIAWSPYYGCYINFLNSRLPRRGKPTQVYNLLQEAVPPIKWIGSMDPFIPASNSIEILEEFATRSNRSSEITNRWIPHCSHWVVMVPRQKPQAISKISPGKIRRYWLFQDSIQNDKSKHISYTGSIHVPNSLPRGFLPPFVWRYFWSLTLPHKVVTVWWRLLNHSLYLQETMFQWNPQVYSSSLCRICRSSSEDIRHFFVECHHKWSFWQAALQQLLPDHDITTQHDVWCTLVSLHDMHNKLLLEDTLLTIGNILEILWKYHWLCIKTESPWSTAAALSLLSSSVSLHFSQENLTG